MFIDEGEIKFASASRQKRGAFQSGVSENGAIKPPHLNYPEQAVAKPVPTRLKDTFSDFSEADRDHGVVLAQISQDEYEVRQGARVVGVVSFYNSRTAWGWRFFPRLHGMRPSIKLHPNPEACLKDRFTIASVLSRSSLNA